MNDTSRAGELLSRARQGDGDALGRLLDGYRAAFRVLAARQLHGAVAARVDASDVIQLAFLEAHRSFEQFAGQDEPSFVAWLRTILDHSISRSIRDHTVARKRDVRREQRSSAASGTGPRLTESLDAGYSTPSQRVARDEEENALLLRLDNLPPDQRDAVRWHYLQGWTVTRIAEAMGRTPASVAGLLRRGLETLRAPDRP